MIFFIVSTIILVLVACTFVVLPFMQPKDNQDVALRDELNKALYKDRLTELEQESQAGLVGNQDELVADLKQSLLDDVPKSKKLAASTVSMGLIVVPSILLIVGLSYGLYAKLGAYQSVSQWQQVSENLPQLSKKLMGDKQQALSEDEMSDLTLALRTRLYYQPNDSTGWLLLGRIALADRDVTMAMDAMAKAYKLNPKNNEVNLGYAQSLMMSPDKNDQNSARAILIKLLEHDYVDVRIFSMLAFDAFERQDFAAAVKYWGLMQQMIGPKDPRYKMLGRSIDNAKQQMQKMGISDKHVAVTLNLAKGVKVDPKSVVIVSVHPADGSPMPVAAARYPLGTFPRTVVIDDNNAMMEGQKLSSLTKMIVRVRIDSDGNVATKDGDWFGESNVVGFDEPISITIDRKF